VPGDSEQIIKTAIGKGKGGVATVATEKGKGPKFTTGDDIRSLVSPCSMTTANIQLDYTLLLRRAFPDALIISSQTSLPLLLEKQLQEFPGTLQKAIVFHYGPVHFTTTFVSCGPKRVEIVYIDPLNINLLRPPDGYTLSGDAVSNSFQKHYGTSRTVVTCRAPQGVLTQRQGTNHCGRIQLLLAQWYLLSGCLHGPVDEAALVRFSIKAALAICANSLAEGPLQQATSPKRRLLQEEEEEEGFGGGGGGGASGTSGAGAGSRRATGAGTGEANSEAPGKRLAVAGSMEEEEEEEEEEVIPSKPLIKKRRGKKRRGRRGLTNADFLRAAAGEDSE
jgi:hypothetical protein